MRNGIKFDDVSEVIKSLPPTLIVEEKAGWVKVSAANGNRVYISKRAIVRQIDLSGFGEGLEGTLAPVRKNGKVQAHINLESPDALLTLEIILRTMSTDSPESVMLVEAPPARVHVENAPPRLQQHTMEAIKPLPSRSVRGTAPPASDTRVSADQAPDDVTPRSAPRARRTTVVPPPGERK